MKINRALPFFTILFSIMLGSYITIGGYPLLPGFFLIFTFYWILCRPDLVPLWSLLFIGIFYDVLMMHILGITSALLILSYYVLGRLRPILTPYNFYFFWGTFVIYSLGYLAFYALITFSLIPPLFSWIFSLLLYPLVSSCLSSLQIRVLSHA
jgi:cell shape-determining protein MreD